MLALAKPIHDLAGQGGSGLAVKSRGKGFDSVNRVTIDGLNMAAGIIDPLEHRLMRGDETDQPVHRHGGVQRGEVLKDAGQQGGQVISKPARLVPVHETARAFKPGKTLVQHLGESDRPTLPRQRRNYPALEGRVAGGFIEDQ